MADYARAHRALTDLAEALSTMEIVSPYAQDRLTLRTMYERQLMRIDATVTLHEEHAVRDLMASFPVVMVDHEAIGQLGIPRCPTCKKVWGSQPQGRLNACTDDWHLTHPE